MESYNPEQAAALIGQVSASTIRNWCKTYATILSPAANPPVGNERRLTQNDVATLQQVRAMREAKRSVEDIVTTLQQAATRLQPTPLTIEAIASPLQSPPSQQEGQGGDLLLPMVLSGVEKRQDASDKRIDALERALINLEQRQGEVANRFVSGAVIGGAVVLVVVAIVLALARYT